VLVRVRRCGVCGSDVAKTSGGAFDFACGTLLGHECAGEVVEVGAAVTRVKVGDRVACMPMAGCGVCPLCLEGRPARCPQVRRNLGGFSDYMAAAERSVVRLPQSLSLADGALVEPIACGLRALRQAGLRGGERVLVLGAGAMAMAVTFWARELGAGAIAVASRSAHRAEMAHVMGADAVIAFDDPDPGAIPRALGGPPDIVAECVGQPGMLARAVEAVRVGGVVISLGMCGERDTLVPAACTYKEARLVFPFAYSEAEFAATVRAFDAGRIRPDLMVSEVIGLDAVADAIADLRAGRRKALKIQVDPAL
jgi:(R,R)-butanediol dehydrogenase/meso-butanediol dehydrogenase/diacetyl reductase